VTVMHEDGRYIGRTYSLSQGERQASSVVSSTR
jgi:hypothetical protein